MGLLDGKIAVVTGAGRGIGRGHARLLAAEGARVVVNDLDRRECRRGGRPRSSTRGRRSDREQRQRRAPGRAAGAVVQAAIDTFGRLDILVNNAGILRDAMSFNITEAEWDAVIDVHLKGHMATCHAAAQHWRARGKAGEEFSGRIINTASESGLFGQAGQIELLDREGRHRLDDDRARARDEEVRRHRQRGVPRALTRMTESMPAPTSSCKARSGTPRTSRRSCASSRATRPPTCRARCSWCGARGCT